MRFIRRLLLDVTNNFELRLGRVYYLGCGPEGREIVLLFEANTLSVISLFLRQYLMDVFC